jgi:hypothetical protein
MGRSTPLPVLNAMNDVTLTDPQDGAVLVYDGASEQWIDGEAGEGGDEQATGGILEIESYWPDPADTLEVTGLAWQPFGADPDDNVNLRFVLPGEPDWLYGVLVRVNALFELPTAASYSARLGLRDDTGILDPGVTLSWTSIASGAGPIAPRRYQAEFHLEHLPPGQYDWALMGAASVPGAVVRLIHGPDEGPTILTAEIVPFFVIIGS